jgi:hypothetical protein
MTFIAYTEDQFNSGSKGLEKGDTVTSFRGEDFTYVGCTHPRKVTVRKEEGSLRDFYASVFNLGIRDEETQEWTFYPEWNPTDNPRKPI